MTWRRFNGVAAFGSSQLMQRIFLLGIVLFTFFTDRIGAATSPVTVVKNPVRIDRRVFDPRHPPMQGGVPMVKPDEPGLCKSDFSCETELGVEVPRTASRSVRVTINTAKVIMGLHITIWTAAGCSPKVIAHEEGHRKISEIYYRNAEAVARKLAEGVVGQQVTVANSGQKSATQTALSPLEKKMIDAFMTEIEQRCEFAQDRFDAITDHCRNPISESEAITRALAEELGRRRPIP